MGMSEIRVPEDRVQRYKALGNKEMVCWESGEYVQYSDYTRVKTELDEARKETGRLLTELNTALETIDPKSLPETRQYAIDLTRSGHYENKRIARVEAERDEARNELGILQRTVKFQEESYLKEHEHWGECKWKEQTKVLREDLEKIADSKSWKVLACESDWVGSDHLTVSGFARAALNSGERPE